MYAAAFDCFKMSSTKRREPDGAASPKLGLAILPLPRRYVARSDPHFAERKARRSK